MKGLWAGGLSLALAWTASAEAEPQAAPRGVGLGRPVAVSKHAPVMRRPDPGVIAASYTPAPIAHTGAADEPSPRTLPETLRATPGKELPRAEVYLSPFASSDRVFGQPIIATGGPIAVAAPQPAPTGVARYLASMRQAFTPAEDELAPSGGMTRYLAGLQQVFAPLGDVLAPAQTEDTPFAPAEAVPGWPYRFYGSAEYLLWWTKGQPLPPLVTTGPPESLGILGQPGTTVLFGGGRVGHDVRSGGRFSFGLWCDDCQQLGVEGNYFFLGRRSARFVAGSDSFPLIARPFFSLNENREFSEVATFPGEVTGSVSVNLPSQLWGGQLNLRKNLCRSCCWNLDLLVGFRYVELEEGLIVVEDLATLPTATAVPPNTRAIVFDSFETRNQFYGGQVGLLAEYRRGPWFLDLRGTVALGNTHQTVTINGHQVVTNAAGTTVFRGGLLALPSNIGRVSRDQFTVVPELGINLGVQVSENLRVFVGYNVLYWSNVVRPGDQIDRVLDITQIPNFPTTAPSAGLGRPLVPLRGTDFWAQGISFGVELRY